jgi:hypothetical protein
MKAFSYFWDAEEQFLKLKEKFPYTNLSEQNLKFFSFVSDR